MKNFIKSLSDYVLALKEKGVKHIYLGSDNLSFLQSLEKSKDPIKTSHPDSLSPKQHSPILPKKKNEEIISYNFNNLSSYCFLIDYPFTKEEFSQSKQKELLAKIARASQIELEKASIFLIPKFTEKDLTDLTKDLKEKIKTLKITTKNFLMGEYSTRLLCPNKNFTEINFSLQNFGERQTLVSPNLDSYLFYPEDKRKNYKRQLWILIKKFIDNETQ